MAFTDKYGDDGKKKQSDDIGTSDETSAQLRAAGFKIVRFGGNLNSIMSLTSVKF